MRTEREGERCGRGGGRGERTPVTNTTGLFGAGVKHGGDDHETGGDGALADSEEKADGEKGAKGGASGVAAEDDGPEKDVDACGGSAGGGGRGWRG